MTSYNNVLNILKENGLKDSNNISEFWFSNIDRLRPIVYGPAVYDDTFSTQVRWKTELGQACQTEVRKYIEATVENVSKQQAILLNENKIQIIMGIIDFSNFSFIHSEQSYTISSFANSFNTSQCQGQSDLRGIDLTGIRIQNCIIKNCWFASANFDKSHFCQVTFDNTNLGNASFCFATVVAIRLENKSTINGVDFEGANINIIHGMDNNSLAIPFIFKEASYKWLICQIFLKIKNKNYVIRHTEKELHTNFLSNDTLSMTSNDLKDVKEYIDWFQNICKKINNLHKFETKKKITFILSVISTKYWTSYSTFALFSIFLNLVFTLFIYFGHSNFSSNGISLNQDFFTSFYYSTVTFTTLGYGDISPNSAFGQLVVIFEVITGYITLGLFVFLISRKIDRGS